MSSKAEIEPIINKFKSLNKLGNFSVSNMDLKDGVKLMFGEKSKILVRPSGTEPLLRIYFESDSEINLSYLKQEVENYLKN